jgi:phosphoribosylaminoimidazole-succinocarboxamide synthase
MLKRKRIAGFLSAALSIGVVCMALAPQAHATTWNERTIFKFTAPVEIPGRVLQPGTYTFQLLTNNMQTTDFVEIYNQYMTKLYAIVPAETAYRMYVTGKTVLTLQERPADSPMAIHKWFYPGNYYGLEFVYPHYHPQLSEMAMKHSKTRSANG